MNKRIRNKRFGKPCPHPWQGLVGLPPGTVIRRRSFYISVDLSTPTLRRAYRKGHQSAVEHRRVEAAIRRRARRDWRRQCRGKWLEPWLRGGHMHREKDWMPKP